MSKYLHNITLKPEEVDNATCFLDVVERKGVQFLTEDAEVVFAVCRLAIHNHEPVARLEHYLEDIVKSVELPHLPKQDVCLDENGIYRPEIVANIEMFVVLNWVLWFITDEQAVVSLSGEKEKYYDVVHKAWLKLSKQQQWNREHNEAYMHLHFRITD